MESFLLQATVFLGTAIIAVPIASRFGLGSVLGYLLAGILIGPSILGFVGSSNEGLQHIAEFGVVMMLFLIGLEMEPRALWNMRHRLLGLGASQVLITTALIMFGLIAIGQSWQVGLAMGMILSLSSTAIVLQTLSEKRLMQTKGGRSAFSVLLTQDIAVIPMLAFLPLLAVAGVSGAAHHGEDAHHGMAGSLVTGLPGWGVTLVTIGAVGGIILAGIFLIRPLFRFIDGANLREMNTAFSLLIVVGIAFLMTLVGLSPALGTFLAGVVLANSEFKHELESHIEPFKGLFLGLFFITVGAGIDFSVFFSMPFLILGLTLGLMTLKGMVLAVLGFISRLRGRDQWLFTLGLAQAGEFGLVLISFSEQQRVIDDGQAEILLLVVAMSMLLTPMFFIFYEWGANKFAEAYPERAPDEIDQEHQVIIAGMGRFGQVVNQLVKSSGFSTTLLDNDMRTIDLVRKFGTKGFFGDPTRPELLRSAGIAKAHVLVVALDDNEAAVKLVKQARKMNPDIHIIARASDRLHVFQLYRAGADDIVRELFDSSLRAGRYVLEHLGLTEFEAHEVEVTFYTLDREAMLELAELWDPDIPITQNKAFIERSKAMDKDLEAALLAMKSTDTAAE